MLRLNEKTIQCRGCVNPSSSLPAVQYQIQKQIQNTVRVQSSLYTMNLAGLTAYQRPLLVPQIVEQAGVPYEVPPKVNWNQMSDRARPSVQVVKTANGGTYHTSSVKHTITRCRPGATSAGGVGVDIKHNSYDRYLNRIKGKAPLKRGIIPPNYGAPIVFNRAYPIYGGKTVKTGIINRCDCGLPDDVIYANPLNALPENILSVTYEYHVGDTVFVKTYKYGKLVYNKAVITNITDGIYTVDMGGISKDVSYVDLAIYKGECKNCSPVSVEEKLLSMPEMDRAIYLEKNSADNIYCKLLSIYSTLEG